MLQDTFDSKISPYVHDIHDVTLNTLWGKQQVLIFYHHEETTGDFWPGNAIPSPWANTTDPENLLKFLEEKYKENRDMKLFHVTQGILTPNAELILEHLFSSLKRQCAEKCNPKFVKWLEEKGAGSGGINVCIMDYVEMCNYVPIILQLNQKMAKSV